MSDEQERAVWLILYDGDWGHWTVEKVLDGTEEEVEAELRLCAQGEGAPFGPNETDVSEFAIHATFGSDKTAKRSIEVAVTRDGGEMFAAASPSKRDGFFWKAERHVVRGPTAPILAFRPIDENTPRDEFVLIRWKNDVSGAWMCPVAATFCGGTWWDGKNEWPEATHWCPIPPIADEGGASNVQPRNADLSGA